MPHVIDDLRRIVGAAHLLLDDDVRAPYETDWTRRWSGRAAAVVRPGSTEEVAAVLRACAGHDAAVIPQGGNTGMVGASVPRGEAEWHLRSPTGNGDATRRQQVVVSLVRLTSLGEVDAASMQVAAGAGVTLAALQSHARVAGL